ncbi:hypothetical protein GGI21_001198 [Coemansia aciculifera]|nr:hypothetical protein GGI21_001198 [Coemansia aciculifera]
MFTTIATRALVLAAGTQLDPSLRWFALLRNLLDCRLFNDRMQVTGICDSLSLTVSGPRVLARPLPSPRSASLGDYFSLDQLESLMGVYDGTCSLSDYGLLHVISDYEQTMRQSIMRITLEFGPNAASIFVKERIGRCRYLIARDENYIGVVGKGTLANSLLRVDSGKLFRTVLNFPVNVTDTNLALDDPAAQHMVAQFDTALLTETSKPGLDVYDSSLVYDPQFILAWVWTVVSTRMQVDIRKLFEFNVSGLAFVALLYYILNILYAKTPSCQRQYL